MTDKPVQIPASITLTAEQIEDACEFYLQMLPITNAFQQIEGLAGIGAELPTKANFQRIQKIAQDRVQAIVNRS